MTEDQQRTGQQNRALHLLFRLVADHCEEHGIDVQQMLPAIDIPMSEELVKRLLWHPIQKKMFNKNSTADLTRGEIDEVYEVFNRYLAQHGIHEPFPSLEELMNQQ